MQLFEHSNDVYLELLHQHQEEVVPSHGNMDTDTIELAQCVSGNGLVAFLFPLPVTPTVTEDTLPFLLEEQRCF